MARALLRERRRDRRAKDARTRSGSSGPIRRKDSGSGFSWLDVKLGLRMLVKYPGLTLVGGLGMTVAIAIGAGFFAFFHSHLRPRIPLEEGDRLVGLENW